MNTKEIIAKYRNKNSNPNTWEMLLESANKMLTEKLLNFDDEIKTVIQNALKEIESIKLKADKYVKTHIESKTIEIRGKDGKDYILTEKDKEQIASQIKVPVVKQIVKEITKEQPIITEITKNIENKDTAQQIASKLNTTTETVNLSVIKGLEKIIETLKISLREAKRGGGKSGGGMGNTQHESKLVQSSTTAVLTSYPISGNGYALWVYYQGQAVARGTGYTVSADKRTLNLLFTPVDGTYVDLIYIR
jgi:hypothetical protein